MAPTPDELRAALFVPPETLEDLHRWIQVYLGVDLPGRRVDPSSTSSPMELIWELYNAARTNDPNYSQVLAYAARDSLKTYSAAIFEVLCVVLLERSVAHMAAIEGQAKKSQQYLKRHMNRPFLRDYVTSRNERMLEITRWYNEETGQSLTVAQYAQILDPSEQIKYREVKNYVTIVICTIQGANSEHVPVMVVDEVDVVENPDAYEEAKMIPAFMDGKMPITLYTSTRKYSYGLVQKEIDKQEETGLLLRHWNLIDVAHKCPDKRSKKDLPKIPIYSNRETLRAISKADWELLESAEKVKYEKSLGYQGCLENCKLYVPCQGRLAELPPCKKCDDKGLGCSGFFKPVEHVQTVFKKVPLEKAKAQLLCWKPSTEGLIYPYFSRETHMLSAAQMAEKIDGEERPETFSKADLIQLFRERGARFVAGIDHGFSHNFAVVLGAAIGNRLFIFDVLGGPELEISRKVELCKESVKPYEPDVWGDTEAPGDNKTLKKEAGLRMKEWVKGKGSVVDGISAVRLLLAPTLSAEPRMYLLKDDAGCDMLATRMSNYHWTKDSAGRITNVPDEEEDDECDAMRYLVMNAMASKTKASFSSVDITGQSRQVPVTDTGQRQYNPSNWMRQVIAEKTGIDYGESEENPGSSGKSGSFSWNL